MDDFDPSSAITILTRGIPRLIEVNCPRHKLWKYLEQLQLLIFGPPCDPFLKLYGSVLTPDDCLTSLLNVYKLRDHLKKQPKDAVYISLILLELEQLSPAVGEFLNDILPCVITSLPKEEVQPCLELLWKREDKSSLPISLIESMLYRRQCIEELIISNYKRAVEGSPCDWSQEPFSQWILWSSESPVIFQTISSVMNQLLICVKNKNSMLRLIHSFVQSVTKVRSDGKSIISLYPAELQALVSILQTNPPEMKSDACFKQLIEYLSAQFELHLGNPYVCLMLLSHFPEWLILLETTQILDYSEQSNFS